MSHADHNITCLLRKREVLLTWQKAGGKSFLFIIYHVCLWGFIRKNTSGIPNARFALQSVLPGRGMRVDFDSLYEKLQTYLLQCKAVWLEHK